MTQLIRLEHGFEGHSLPAYLWEGKSVWIAKDVGRVMGYGEEGKGLVDLLRQDWREELIEGADLELLEGERLIKFKADAGGLTRMVDSHQKESAPLVAHRTASLLLLKESGFHLVCLKTEKAIGRRMRRWLAGVVMPSLLRTGGYQVNAIIEKDTFETQGTAALEAVAQKAASEAVRLLVARGSIPRPRKPREDRQDTPVTEQSPAQEALRQERLTLKQRRYALELAVIARAKARLDKLEARNQHIEAKLQAKANNEPFGPPDLWEIPVQVYLVGKTWVTAGALLEECLGSSGQKWTRSDEMRVAAIVRHLGWKRVRQSTGERLWGYAPALTSPRN